MDEGAKEVGIKLMYELMRRKMVVKKKFGIAATIICVVIAFIVGDFITYLISYIVPLYGVVPKVIIAFALFEVFYFKFAYDLAMLSSKRLKGGLKGVNENNTSNNRRNKSIVNE